MKEVQPPKDSFPLSKKGFNGLLLIGAGLLIYLRAIHLQDWILANVDEISLLNQTYLPFIWDGFLKLLALPFSFARCILYSLDCDLKMGPTGI